MNHDGLLRATARAAMIGVLAVAVPSPLVAQTASSGGMQWQPHVGVHVGSPQVVSVALGIMRPVWRSGDFTALGGPRVVVEPGWRAGKLRVGYARTGAFATGYAIEVAVLREWGREGKADLPSTAYGAELHGSLMFIDLGIGAYQGTDGTTRLALSAGLVL